jgi:calpain-7
VLEPLELNEGTQRYTCYPCEFQSSLSHYLSQILSSIVYPYDHNIQYPILSANGKYVFRLHFNGCFRKVVIDDRLPSSKTSRALHVIDRNNPGLLWPALVEKAYLKVRGGYDFPGSNSGTDIWVLTNWIPEQIFLHQEDVISDALWKRVFNAFSYGDVLLTIGTGKLSRKEERQTGLAGEHDYAILDLKEEEYRRMVLVKNPWSEGSVWKGFQRTPNPSPDDVESKSDQNEEELAPGSFWINFNHIFQYFESLYLNWNPGLFSCRQDVHFNWDLSQLSSVPSCFARNPQYSLKTSEGGSVWLLLSRHFKTGDYVHSAGQGGPPTIIRSEPGFISLYAFNKQGERVFLSDSAIHRGPFVDSPNTLLRFEMPASSTYTIVVSGQSLPRSSFTFSLSAFSLHPVVLSPAKDRYTHSTDITAAWTLSTAGGNADSPLYTSNPQFSLTIPRFQFPSRATVLAMLLETTNPELPVHIKLFRTNPSTRVATVRTRDIYADSGEYRRGCALLSHNDLEPGTYAIICSTFHKAQLAHFILRAFTSTPFTLAPLPAEGAGRLRLRPEPAIFPIEVERVLAPLTPKRLTRLFIVATHSPSPQQATGQQRASPPSPLKLSIELGQGPYKEVLAVSNDDEFSDAVTGVRIEDLDLTPELLSQGGIWLVLERMGSSGSESVDVELLSEEVVGLGRWGTGSG